MMLASMVLPRPTSSARIARPPICRSTRWATSIWWGSSLIALASSVISRSKPGTSAMRSASRRRSYQARSVGGPFSCSAKSVRDRSSTAQVSSGGAEGLRVGGGRWGVVTPWLDKSGDAIWKGGGSRRHPGHPLAPLHHPFNEPRTHLNRLHKWSDERLPPVLAERRQPRDAIERSRVGLHEVPRLGCEDNRSIWKGPRPEIHGSHEREQRRPSPPRRWGVRIEFQECCPLCVVNAIGDGRPRRARLDEPGRQELL